MQTSEVFPEHWVFPQSLARLPRAWQDDADWGRVTNCLFYQMGVWQLKQGLKLFSSQSVKTTNLFITLENHQQIIFYLRVSLFISITRRFAFLSRYILWPQLHFLPTAFCIFYHSCIFCSHLWSFFFATTFFSALQNSPPPPPPLESYI